MRKIILLTFLWAFTHVAFSQSFNRYKFEAPWSVSASLGPTQYFGELYSLWKYNEGIQPDFNANIAARYTMGTRIKARAEFSYYKISGQDPPADPRSNRPPRNLHFRAQNWEASLIGEYHLKPVKLYNITRHLFNLYAFAGIGVSSNDPKAELRGEWVSLRPYQLENNPYEKFIMVFPTGLGMKYKINVYMDMIVEMNYRWTLTDYMDDISAYNVKEFYLDLVNDYGVNGNGTNPDRLRLAIRNPDFVKENGEPDIDKILRNNGRVRRGSGLTEKFDGYLGFNIGLEIYLSPDIWDNWIFRDRIYEKRFRWW
ncbi:hypothetical protein P872_15160 [Rhodonellum psychrophilum GCM71 = DSM 17998]|uniref:Outer membrane protein beta-barrel domain-containing protein n=2 Tax=Rhodonellum TaxID=336827 RepID=U5C878_9BACT|nr:MULTISPECIES: hypothetical protein [Rhodonellum]ERM84382.1 hypothetical protein P872_15160 [Rhodonellum psychrophilum GCM71 = DSM 17998]SDZ42369.1 hypothetical protein SAMN05444412_11410 [Rhodonellum ikkaensis]